MRTKILAFSRSTFASMRQRNFRLYFIGQNISMTGGWMQAVAQSWLILHLTGSGTALGIVSALQYAPTLLVGPYAGVLAGRFPKRRLLYVTQTLSGLFALALGVAVATNTIQVWMVYATAAVLGVVTAIDYPTRQAFLYDLAGPRELLSAVGLTSTAANLARVVGPAIAGALIAAAGMAACFYLNAASFVAVLVCLAMMRPKEFHRAVLPQAGGGLAEGVSYARRTPVVREAILMMAIIGVFTFEFSVTLPVFVKMTLGSNAAGLAALMSAMGLGAAVGGIVTAGRRGDGLGRLAMAALAFGVFTGLVGLSPNLLTATIVMFFVGVSSARFTGLCNGLLQLRSDPALRTRVLALWSTAFLGSAFLGAPLVGWLSEVASPRWSLGVGALGGVVAGVIGWLGARREAKGPAPAPSPALETPSA